MDNQNLKAISSEVLLSKFKHDEEISYNLDTGCTWVKEISDEISPESKKSTSLSINFSLKRRHTSEFNDHLIIKGSFSSSYSTECVKCLIDVEQNISGEFAACFLSHTFEKMEEFKDSLTLFVDGIEAELYFHKKGKFNLKEFIHEQVLMEIDPLPLHSPDCKGLCQICGVDLNITSCKHNS